MVRISVELFPLAVIGGRERFYIVFLVYGGPLLAALDLPPVSPLGLKHSPAINISTAS